MKKYLLVFFLIIVAVIPAAAAETGGSFTIGNNNLPEEEMDSADFKGMDFLWGMSAFWEKEANDISGIRVGFYRDTVLNNLAYTNLYYNDDLFNIVVGPFLGLLNTAQTMI
ncbi:MAG: hypothetical protein PQJ61_02825, partial [Spirochaetales bacterium]|nr:hypothetical protein [Spirochaetales bacterium]